MSQRLALGNLKLGSVSRRERHWVIGFAVIVMFVTSLPYLIGFGVQGQAYRFTGFVIGIEDGLSYVAKMLTGSEGAWLFRTPYTAYPQQGMMIFLPYILLGKLVAPPASNEQLVAMYHLFRFIAGILAILATYDFLSQFIAELRLRRFGLVLAILGGGLGWLLVVAGVGTWLGTLPLEFYSPESFGFLGLYAVPHLALARALMLWGLVAYLKAMDFHVRGKFSFKVSIKIGLIWLGVGLAQPLTGMVIGVVVIIHILALAGNQLWRRRQSQPTDWRAWRNLLKLSVVAGIIPVPLVLYSLFSFALDPYLKTWAAQSPLPSPHPFHYLLAYGLLIPFAIIGGRSLIVSLPWKGWLPVAWAFALPVLVYAPIGMQRRLSEGIWVALVTLAVAALGSVKLGITKTSQTRTKRKTMVIASLLILCLLFPSTLFLIAGGMLVAGKPSEPAFRMADEIRVFTHLAANAELGQVVLASYNTGNALPAWAPLCVVIGHGPESANIGAILPQVTDFYRSTTSDSQRQDFLRHFDVRYVFLGPAERDLGDWDPSQEDFLGLMYQSGEYAVFEVIK